MSQRKIPRRAVNGVLLLDKPTGLSSNHALQQVKRLFNAAKAGHTGTLDPLASGLLPLTFGEATKFSQMLLDADKCYRAIARLGVTTTTGDAEGELLRERACTVGASDVEAVLERFGGESTQIPPMYSALKREGRPLYELARQGIEVPRESRKITVHELSLVRFEDATLVFDVRCSKGTYVRTLAEDIGEALGCGAHLTALRRTAIGNLHVAAATTLDALAALKGEERDCALAPVDSLVEHLPSETLNQAEADIILHGGAIVRAGRPPELCRLYGPGGFLGLGRVDETQRLWPKRLFANAQ